MNNKFIAIIGVQKAGTTTIYTALNYCNEIYSPNYLKDYHIFLHPDKNEQIINKYRSAEGPISLHCGVNYINFKDSILEILKFNPDTKFILVLRNPIDRAISGFTYAKRMGLEKGEFIQAVKYELDKNDSDICDINPDKDYLKHGLYYKLIKNNLAPYVDIDNVGIFIFEEIFENNQINIDEIVSFIGVDRFNYPKSIKKNIGGEAKVKLLNKLLYYRSPFKTKTSALFPPKLRVKLKRLIYGYNYKPLDNIKKYEFDYNLLVKYYQQDVRILSNMLKKDLNKLWFNEN